MPTIFAIGTAGTFQNDIPHTTINAFQKNCASHRVATLQHGGKAAFRLDTANKRRNEHFA